MSFTRWLRNLRSVIAPAGVVHQRRSNQLRRKPAARYRLQLEVLENRLTPSTLTVTTDPLLGPLADNGGPTQTMALLAGSPAIDQGANPDLLTTDQRGVPFVRTFGSQTDMGAFELNAFITTSTLSSDRNPSLEGQPIAFSAFVSAGNVAGVATPAKGDVTFLVDAIRFAVVTLENGAAHWTADKLAAGPHLITVSYAAQEGFAASEDSLTQNVTAAFTATTSTLSSDRNPSVEGQPIAFSAFVSAGNVAGVATPAKGDVTFLVDAIRFAVVTLENGTARWTADKLAAGPHVVTVSYAAQDGFAASEDSLTQNVTAALTATTSTLSSDRNPSVEGQPITFTAFVSAGNVAGVATPAKGDVTFIVDAITFAIVTLENGTARWTADKLAAGPHVVTVSYAAQDGFAASEDSLTQNVTAALTATTSTLSSDRNPSVEGQPITFTAFVSAGNVAGVATPAKGDVTFIVDAITFAIVTLENGTARWTADKLAAGPHVVTVSYAAQDGFAASEASITQNITAVVARATPTISALTSATIVVGTTSATLGGKIGLGALVPTGDVAITVGAVTAFAAIQADGTFSASVKTGTLPAGSYTITYSYEGDANFTPAKAAGTIVVLSAQEQTVLIVDQVTALITAGILDKGSGKALTSMLNNAIVNLDNSKTTTPGVKQLNAIIKQVQMSGKLDSTNEQALISAIDEAIAAALFSPIQKPAIVVRQPKLTAL